MGHGSRKSVGHAWGTLASYGWHYCSGDGKGRDRDISRQGERTTPSSNTGCGHNYAYHGGGSTLRAGDGTLWVK